MTADDTARGSRPGARKMETLQIPTGQPMACCVEGPPAYVPKARYALRMLLVPLGREPRWVEREALEGPALYYGPDAGDLSSSVAALSFDPEAPAYFEQRTSYDPAAARWEEWDNARWPVLFGSGAAGDLVASAFFWLSGWQEHTIRQRDQHGRFPFAASLQARWDRAAQPMVDAYRERLAGRLDERGVPVQRRRWAGKAWAFCPTHDIDYLKKWRKGLVYREVMHYAVQNRRGETLQGRVRRLERFLQDWLRPGDVFQTALRRIREETQRRGGRGTYFVKTGAHSPHDVAYDAENPLLEEQVTLLQKAGFEVGLHPSYHAHTHSGYLQAERDQIIRLIGTRPLSIRNHYLRHEAPATPRLQQRLGFRIDATLGWAQREGFRHGTCLPFQLFDITANAPLPLWEMPLCMMDTTLFTHRDLTTEERRDATEALLRTCQQYGGVAVMLWHNTLWDELDYPGWGPHFLDTLDAAHAEGAHMTSLQDALRRWRVG